MYTTVKKFGDSKIFYIFLKKTTIFLLHKNTFDQKWQ